LRSKNTCGCGGAARGYDGGRRKDQVNKHKERRKKEGAVRKERKWNRKKNKGEGWKSAKALGGGSAEDRD